ncbi:MAG: hypothetical protein Q8R08_01205 [bacterium]|nr:hypothetical protein [bacterium]
MFGVILMSISTFLDEIFSSFGKRKVTEGFLSKYSTGFIQVLGGLVFFLLISIFKNNSFVFQVASLPTFLPRLLLEILQAHAMMTGLIAADRSTFGFIRVGTVPLLLVVDIVLGYTLSSAQLWGVAVIVFCFLFVFFGKAFSKVGSTWVIFGTVNAVVTLSLYKYNITHFNSVVGEQTIVQLVVLLYFFGMAVFSARENPMKFLKDKIYLFQAIVNGLSDLAGSFAYSYGAASIILSAKRSSEALWASLSGGFYFMERKVWWKLLIASLLILGLILLAF